MKEYLLKIINHYGVSNQLKKLNEECYELIEAINNYEWCLEEKGRCQYTHITEEIADVLIMIKQFQMYYGIDKEDIKKVIQYKVKRQLERIEKESDVK